MTKTLNTTANLAIIFFVIVSIISCARSKTIDVNLGIIDKDLKVNCNLNRIYTRNVDELTKRIYPRVDKLTYVYAKIEIINYSNLPTKYNIGRYYLSYNNKISSGIYIDSVANYLIVESILKPNEKITKSVYWVFQEALNPDDLKNIKFIAR